VKTANLHQLHAFDVLVKAPPWIVATPSSTVQCSAFMIGLTYLRDQVAMCRKLVEQADDPLVKTEMLALASVCEEIAENIEDHLTSGKDHAPRGPLSRLS
jgi:hypothetical protein